MSNSFTSRMKCFRPFLIAGCLTLSAVTPSLAQAPLLQWEQQFDGLLNGKDISRSLVIDDSNNIYITGTSYQTFQGGNFSTIKYNPSGVLQWSDHHYAVQAGHSNIGKKILLSPDGAIYAVGTLAINDGDMAIIKYGTNGKLWAKNYEPYMFNSYDDYGIDMGCDTSGNFYAIAQVLSPAGNMEDLYIMKCDSSGTKQWDHNYSAASGPDYPVALAVSPSGTSYPLLQAYNFFGTATNDITTIQYLTNSTENWLSKYNGSGNADDYPAAIVLDSQDNQYVCGIADAGATNDMVAMKQNIYGTRLWTYTYNGSANENDSAVAIRYLSNNLTVVTGKCREFQSGFVRDAIVTLLIDSGTVVWTKKYFGDAGIGAVPTQMIVDASDNIYISGYENSTGAMKEACIIKYSASGTELWNLQYSGIQGFDDVFTGLALDNNQDLVATGQTTTAINNANYLTVKYSNPTSTSELSGADAVMQVYPNPAVGMVYIKNNVQQPGTHLSILDVNGNIVYTEKEHDGVNEFQIDCSGWSAGIYTVRLAGSHSVAYSKVVVAP
jgi:Secretion system C-terminal sorting domain